MKESEIRPQELMRKYIELSAKDAKLHFGKEKSRNLACVGCNKPK